MNILNHVYHKSIVGNERNIQFWEEYLKSLHSLDFNVYSKKLKVPTLVPIGSRIFFRGELKHTNEITVALGADYFVKCSLSQAEKLRQHRIKKAQAKLDLYIKEKTYLESHLSLSKHTVFEDYGQVIAEMHTEAEDKEWREKHKQNIKKYKQNKYKTIDEKDISDEELWNRLEQLELQEELENELLDTDDDEIDTAQTSFIIKDENIFNTNQDEEKSSVEVNPEEKEMSTEDARTFRKTSHHDLLQQVVDKQNELENKLSELKNRDRSKSKTENDLISRLDEMEQLDELEDEMDRLYDILENEEVLEDNKLKPEITKLKRSVSFADEDDSETLEISFKHSDVASIDVPYNPEKGITKPSDIYEAYGNLINRNTSILKKPKNNDIIKNKIIKKIYSKPEVQEPEVKINRTIVVNDVKEKLDKNENKLEEDTRPTSLFKKKRMQNKI